MVAATLLDLKAARLLPSGEVEDEEDLALLEARDLLFARLLQYRAYKQVAAVFAGRMADEAGRFPRAVSLEPQLREPAAGGAARARAAGVRGAGGPGLHPEAGAEVSVDHMHAPAVSVREQAAILVDRAAPGAHRDLPGADPRLRGHAARRGPVPRAARAVPRGRGAFEQVDPLGELHIRWTGTDEGEVDVLDEFDEVDDDRQVADEREPADEGEPAGGGPTEDAPHDEPTIDLRETSTDDDA